MPFFKAMSLPRFLDRGEAAEIRVIGCKQVGYADLAYAGDGADTVSRQGETLSLRPVAPAPGISQVTTRYLMSLTQIEIAGYFSSIFNYLGF